MTKTKELELIAIVLSEIAWEAHCAWAESSLGMWFEHAGHRLYSPK